MQNILITGATSFIGKYLITELQKENVRIYALVRPNSPKLYELENNCNIYIIRLDFTDTKMLKRYIQKIDVCYHLAWNGTRGEYRHDDELQASNYVNSIELYKDVKALGCKVFIGIGSQAEYGLCNELITEETTTVPNTAYGKWKLATGQKLVELGNRDGIRVVWGRVFSIYGKGDYEYTLIMSSIRKMKNNEPIDTTDGTQYWNYLYVEDLAKILTQLANSEKARGIINLASDDNRLLKDYIFELKTVLESKSDIRLGAIPYRTEGKVEIRPQISKLLSILEKRIVFTKFSEAIRKLVC